MGHKSNHKKRTNMDQDEKPREKISKKLGLRYATGSRQGHRPTMEDAHYEKIGIFDENPFNDWSFFAVYDGHSGSEPAQFTARHMLHTLIELPDFQRLRRDVHRNGGEMTNSVKKELKIAIKSGFFTIDKMLRDFRVQNHKGKGGSTAICAIVTPDSIFIANLGDSRAVLCRGHKAIFATKDHKPELPEEQRRIVKAGANVYLHRVNGSLAMSRALGDFKYKNMPGLPSDDFLVLACDGVFDVFDNQDLCQFIHGRLSVTGDLEVTINQVLNAALSRGSTDNMTLTLVLFDEMIKKPDPSLAAEEKKWLSKVEHAITEVLDQSDQKGTDDVEITPETLKLDEAPSPGSIHLATALLDEILKRRQK